MKKLIYLSLILIWASCKAGEVKTSNNPTLDPAHNSRNSVDWQGTYRGVALSPVEDGIRTELSLSDKGSSYEISVQYVGKDTPVLHYQGVYTWINHDGAIQLLGLPFPFPDIWRVGENRLNPLVKEGENMVFSPFGELRHVRVIPTLLDKRWQLIELNGHKIETPPQSERFPYMYFLFKDNDLIGSTGCNMFQTKHKEGEDYEMSIDSTFRTTKMFCEDVPYEHAFLEALGKVKSYEVKDNILWLFDEQSVRILVMEERYWD